MLLKTQVIFPFFDYMQFKVEAVFVLLLKLLEKPQSPSLKN